MEARSSFSSARFSCAGKVFVLGEYAVLAGESAVVMAAGPRFELLPAPAGGPVPTPGDSTVPVPRGGDSSPQSFAPESPAGRLLAWARARGLDTQAVDELRWRDPLAGAGGFGASTAQFALVHQALARGALDLLASDWLSAWTLYRELTGAQASGADLAAQILGGVIRFENPGATAVATPITADVVDPRALVVLSATAQAGRKVATHGHLKSLALDPALVARLGAITRAALDAGAASDRPRALGAAFDAYAAELAGAGLELEATRADRAAFRAIAGVHGVKGAGAMQADALVLSAAPGAHAEIARVARERGLGVVSLGAPAEGGLA